MAASVPDDTSLTCSQPDTRSQMLRRGAPRPGWVHRRRAECQGLGDRGGHHRMGMAEEHGAIGLDHVDVAAALDVPHVRPVAARHVYGVPPTAANERTGESTPPGITRRARSNHPALEDGASEFAPAPSPTVPDRSVTQSLGDLSGEVRQDDIGTCPLERDEVFERDRVTVDPTPARRLPSPSSTRRSRGRRRQGHLRAPPPKR